MTDGPYRYGSHQQASAIPGAVQAPLALRIGLHLRLRGLPDVDDGLALEHGSPPYTRRGTDLEILALLLHRKPPKLMIVDEVHHLLAGSVREQRQSLNQLKFLSNELRVCQ